MVGSYVIVLVLIVSLLENSARSVAKVTSEDGSRQSSTKVKLSLIQSEYIQLHSNRNTDRNNKVIRDIIQNDRNTENNDGTDLSKRRVRRHESNKRDEARGKIFFKKCVLIRTGVDVSNKIKVNQKSDKHKRRLHRNANNDKNTKTSSRRYTRCKKKKKCKVLNINNGQMKRMEAEKKIQLIKKKNDKQKCSKNRKKKRSKILKNKIVFLEGVTDVIKGWYNEKKNYIDKVKFIKILENKDNEDFLTKKILIKINNSSSITKKYFLNLRRNNNDFLTQNIMAVIKNWLATGRKDKSFLEEMLVSKMEIKLTDEENGARNTTEKEELISL